MTGLEPGAAAVGAGFAALGTAAVLTEVARRVGLRHRLVDVPTGHKAHDRPTPNLGGAAIVLSTLFAASWYLPRWKTALTVTVVCAVAVALLGLADDLRPLSPGARLRIEAVLATLVALAGVRVPVFGGGLDIAVTVVWIVVVTNSWNLLDNMDGSAAAVGLASAGCLAAAGSPDACVVLCALAAACGGFLVHNWAPARIFMGDCGSLFLGFMITCLSAMVPAPEAGVPAATGVLLFALVPVLDTTVVLISRRLAGRPLLSGGTDHLSHRLCRLGLSTQQAAAVLCALAGAASFGGMCVERRWLPASLVLAVAAPAAAVLVLTMLRVPVYKKPTTGEVGPVPPRLGNISEVRVVAPLASPDSSPASDNPRQDAQVGMAN